MNPLLMNLLIEIVEEYPDAARRFVDEYDYSCKLEKDTPYFLQSKLKRQRGISYISAWLKNNEFNMNNSKFIRQLAHSNVYLREGIAKHQDKWIPFLRKISDCEKPMLEELSTKLWILKAEYGIDEIEFSDLAESLGTSIVMDEKATPKYWDKIYTDGLIEEVIGSVSKVPAETSHECRIRLNQASFAAWTRHSIDPAAIDKDKRFLYLTDLNFDFRNLEMIQTGNPEFEYADDVKGEFEEHSHNVEDGKTSTFVLSDKLPHIKRKSTSILYK